MKNPLVFLFGYTLFSAPAHCAADIAELFRRAKIPYGDISFEGEAVRFRVSAFSTGVVSAALRAQGIEFSITARRGLPAIMWRYRRRWGALVGAAVFFLILAYSPLVLWDIRIIGGGDLDAESVKQTLRECGLCEGDFLWTIDTPDIETRAILARDDIGWISINLLGSVAEVELVEYTPPPESETYLSTDVAAGQDGKILWIEDARGYQAKTIGDEVKKGEIIISGVYPADETAGLPERYALAKGRVYARTAREFSVSVPLNYEKKSYTGREKSEKSLIFFKNEIKIFRKSGNLYPKYDTIETVEYITLPGGILLPFGIRTVRYAEYEYVSAERSEGSAAALARYILRGLEKKEICEGSLLKKSESATVSDGVYYLNFKGEYIENISVIIPRGGTDKI